MGADVPAIDERAIAAAQVFNKDTFILANKPGVGARYAFVEAAILFQVELCLPPACPQPTPQDDLSVQDQANWLPMVLDEQHDCVGWQGFRNIIQGWLCAQLFRF